MARGRGNRLSRAFANLDSSSVREAEPQVVSRNLAINLNGADGVVCQVQDHAQGVDETIEVTVVPKRSLRRVIVRVEDDESSRGSSEPEVVVTTSKSGSDHLCRRQRQHWSNGRNDENIPPANNSDRNNGEDGGDIPIRIAKDATRDRKAMNRDNRGHHDGMPAHTSSGSSADQGQPSYAPVNRPTRPASMMPAPRSTGRGHSSIAESSSASARPLSVTSDLARRIRQLNPFKSSRATEDRPIDKGKSKDTGSYRHSKRRSEMYRHGDCGYDNDNDSGRTRSSQAESSGFSTPTSYLDDYEHRCHSCEKPRNANFQKEHPVREDQKVRPNLCTDCRGKLEYGRYRVLGPNGEDLSEDYWCKICGFQRSKRYLPRNGHSAATEAKSDNICSLCTRNAQHRKEERRREDERRREAASPEPKPPARFEAYPSGHGISSSLTTIIQPTGKGRNDSSAAESSRTHRQDNPPSASSTTFSSASTNIPERRTNNENGERSVPSDFALAPAPTHHRRRVRSSRVAAGPSQPRQDDISTNTIDNLRGKAKVDNTTQAAGGGSSRMAYHDNEAVQTEVDNGNGRRNTPAPASASVQDQDDEGQAEEAQPEGFIHNSAAAWAALDIDDVLLRAMTMDPAERAARRARLYGEQPRRTSSPPGFATRGASPAMQFTGPRIVDLTSDDEDE